MEETSMAQHILDMALELGKLIKESEQFKNTQIKEADMFQDEEAKKLLGVFRDTQMAYAQKQQKGEKLTPGDIKAFEEMELTLLENSNIKEFTEAKGLFDDLLKTVNETINKAMEPDESEQDK